MAGQKQREGTWQELGERQACPVPTRIGDCAHLAENKDSGPWQTCGDSCSSFAQSSAPWCVPPGPSTLTLQGEEFEWLLPGALGSV